MQNVQPSPLALLAATCSRIGGDAFHQQEPPVYTQKNLSALIDEKRNLLDSNATAKTCAIESRTTSGFPSLERTTSLNRTTTTETTLDTLHHQLQQHSQQIQQHSQQIQQHSQQIQQHHHQQQQHQQQQQQQSSTPNYSPTYTTDSQQIASSCFKIKTEETLDYNQNNTENMHICPNINETRMLENQARASFGKSCCHEPIQSPTSCIHQQSNSPPAMNLNSAPSCQHEIPSPHLPSPTNSSHSSSSCLYQTSPVTQQQPSSCDMTNIANKYQSNILSHLPTQNEMSINNNNNNNSNTIYSGHDNFARYKPPSINPWQNQNVHRINDTEELSSQQKPSCMLHENYNSVIPTSNVQPSSQQIMSERGFRSYSPPEQERQFSTPAVNFSPQRQPELPTSHSIESHHSSPHYPGSQSMTSHHHQQQQQQTYDSYSTTFESPMDIKPSAFTLQQQQIRQQQHQQQHQQQQANIMAGNYSPHDPHSHPMNTSPEQQLGMPPTPISPHYPIAHNHPAGMTSYSCNACNITNSYNYPSPMHQTAEAVPVHPMTGAEIPPHYAADYQYQQQQMFYSRDTRRPRRIACTCPNCRDGENKTVTTKDGKQRKLHICHIPGCGKIYGKTSHLRAHLRWHAGERPFACNWLFCNKRFTRSDELQRHRRTHTGDKRFECTICYKKFMRSDHLSKHMKTHQSQQNKQKEKNNTTDKTSNNNNTSAIEKATTNTIIEDQQQHSIVKNNNSVITNQNSLQEKTTAATTKLSSSNVAMGISESLTL